MFLNKSLALVTANVIEERYNFENSALNNLCLYKIERALFSILLELGVINFPNAYRRTPFACISNTENPTMEVMVMQLPSLGGLMLAPNFNGETRKMENSCMYCRMENNIPYLIIEFPYLRIGEVNANFINGSKSNVKLETYLKYPTINSTRIKCNLIENSLAMKVIEFLEWHLKYTFSLQFHNLRNFFLYSNIHLKFDDGDIKVHIDEKENKKTLEMYRVLDFLKDKYGKV